MGWRWLENQSAPTKMAAARNTSAGAVLPVPAGTSQGIAAMAAPITTLTTLRRLPAAGGRDAWRLRRGQAGKRRGRGGGQGGHWATSLTSRSSRSRCRTAKSGWSAVTATSASPASSTSRHSVPWCAQAGQRGGDKGAHQAAEPALPGDRVPDPGAPAVRAQPRMAGDPVAGTGMPVEVQGVAECEPGHVAQRLAGQFTSRPVHDAGHRLPGDQEVAGPVVTVHDGARRAGRRQARSHRAKLAGQRGGASVARPAGGDLPGHAVQQCDGRGPGPAVSVQGGEPVPRRP